MKQSAQSELEQKISFIMDYASAVHIYGAPAHRLERLLGNVSRKLGLDGQFFCTPTALMASFETPIGRRPALSRIEPGAINLEKTILLDKVGADVFHGRIDHIEAREKVNEILNKPCLYNNFLRVLAFGFISMKASLLLGGALAEMISSLIIGMLVGVISITTEKRKSSSRIYESLAAFLAFIISSAIYMYYPSFSTQVVTIASLIVLIPGLTLTTGVEELSTMNLTSGTSRLMQALVSFFKIGFGLVIASQIVNNFFPATNHIELSSELPAFLNWILLFTTPVAFTILFRARLKELFWIFLACSLSLLSSSLVSGCFGAEMGAFISGCVVGLAGNIYSRLTNKPGAVTLVPALLLLVPGSIGFKGINYLLNQDTILGLDLGFDMFIIAVALAAGLIFANMIVTTKKSL